MDKINIPTALSFNETILIKNLSRNKKVLEIGSLLGYSTINMAKEAKAVTSIDPHEGYPYKGAETTIFKFKYNLTRYNINNVKIIQDIFENVKKEKYDFVFIDLSGKYELTKKVLEYVQNIPVVVIHDFARQNCSGVEKAIKDSGANLIQVIDTCAIIKE